MVSAPKPRNSRSAGFSFFSAGLAAVLLAACGAAARDPFGDGRFETIAFAVHEDLVGEPRTFDALGFVYRAPKASEPLEEGSWSALLTRPELEGYIGRVEALFVEPRSGTLSLVSSLSADRRTLADFVAGLDELGHSAELIREKIRVNGRKALQYRILTPEVVLVKLVFEPNRERVIVLDYVVSRSSLQASIPVLESSIGAAMFH